MVTNSREARRRKIMERGADRLALITGRIQTLPSSSSCSAPPHPATHNEDTYPPSQPSISPDQIPKTHVLDHIPVFTPEIEEEKRSSSSTVQNESPTSQTRTHVPDQIPVFTSEIEEIRSPPSTVQDESPPSTVQDESPPSTVQDESPPSTVQNESPTSQTRTHVPDQIPVFTSEIEEIRSPPSTVQDESPPSTVQDESPPSTVQNELPPSSLSFEKPRLFIASRISSAIEASERTRIYISMAVALLVVFAHFGFPLLGSKMVKTLLGFRPIYLVLVTNVTLVLARIFDSGPQRLSRVPAGFGDCQNLSGTEYEWAERLGMALGIGLKGKKVLDALFMDCAVYAIIVVCGLSFAQHFS